MAWLCVYLDVVVYSVLRTPYCLCTRWIPLPRIVTLLVSQGARKTWSKLKPLVRVYIDEVCMRNCGFGPDLVSPAPLRWALDTCSSWFSFHIRSFLLRWLIGVVLGRTTPYQVFSLVFWFENETFWHIDIYADLIVMISVDGDNMIVQDSIYFVLRTLYAYGVHGVNRVSSYSCDTWLCNHLGVGPSSFTLPISLKILIRRRSLYEL